LKAVTCPTGSNILFNSKINIKIGLKTSNEALHPKAQNLKTVTCPTG